MPRPFPPLADLRAFEAVARHLNFTRAAEELLVTQAAVSRRIRALEAGLGTELFHRHSRRVVLTPAGETLRVRVAEALAILADGLEQVGQADAAAVLRVTLLPSFAAHWLVPRLPDFRRRHPEIDLRLDPGYRLADIAGGEADLGIRYGEGDWPGLTATLLFPETLALVGAPELLRRSGSADIADLLRLPLLAASNRLDWTSWLAGTGCALDGARIANLHDYNLVLQAAADGQGLAIGRLRLMGRWLADGRLALAHPRLVDGVLGHYLVAPRRTVGAARPFARWLVTAAQADPGPDTAKLSTIHNRSASIAAAI